MSPQSIHFQVPPETARVRLDKFLLSLLPKQSRSQIQAWIRTGRVLVNQRPVKSGHMVRPGDVIELYPPQASSEDEPQPENIPLRILYEDNDLAVLEKPAGMICHAGAGVRSGTLVNALLHHMGPLQTGDIRRPGIVHRLDKLTSGLLVVAKNLETHRGLAQQFKSRQVMKEYLALVYGRPRPPAGTLDQPLGRDPGNRKKISVISRRRREAITHYREEKTCGTFTLLRVRIETGRTHQIRVHLAHMGNPVVGDTLYGGNRIRSLKDPRTQSAIRGLDRHFLHAHHLEFSHPRTGERLAFTSPLPPELVRLLELVE